MLIDGVPEYINKTPSKTALEAIISRRDEVKEILKRIRIDGAKSPENIRHELAQGLKFGGVYNIPCDELMRFLVIHFSWREG